MIKLIIAASIAASSFYGAWSIQDMRYGKRIASIALEDSKRKFTELEKAHAETIRLQDQKDIAVSNANKKFNVLLNDFNHNRSAIVRLSDAADELINQSKDSLAACNAGADALRIVFEQCSQRYYVVGKAAQGHVIDKQALIESWPKEKE